MSLERTNMRHTNTVRIAEIKECGEKSVYNMEVDDNHNFAINGGLIVHNCADSIRYLCKTKRIVKRMGREQERKANEQGAIY